MTPLIMTGAWAEVNQYYFIKRMNFKAFCLFVIIWPLLVYYPLAHWYFYFI
jgi:Amt family ammonium transporter